MAENVLITNIKIGERFRKEYGGITELAESIKNVGLLHPIVLDSDNNLMAGGRRLVAMNELGWVEVPVTRLADCDELTRREIELEENVQREDLTWQEKAKLTEEIDRLKREKYGDGAKDRIAGHSLQDTADLLGVSKSKAGADIQLAEAMKMFPELEECKTADEANRTLKKMVEKLAVQELLNRRKEEASSDEEKIGFAAADASFMIGDCIEGMKALGDEIENLILAEVDPPYGIDLHDIRQIKVDKNYNEIPKEKYPHFLRDVAAEVFRVLAPDAWCVWWFGQEHQRLVYNTLTLAGFDVDQIPAVWIKQQGQANQPEKWFARAWEGFFLCRKGSPTMHKRGRINVFAFPGVPHQRRIHPTERPLELMEEIVTTLCHPGSGRVLVPFLGSGNTVRAAYRHGMTGLGWDIAGEETKQQFTRRLLIDLGVELEI